MLPDILSLDYCDRNNMDVPPTYWADVNDCQENIGDTTEPNLPPLDTNMQLAVWLPFHSTPASLSPGLFPRANTAPLQYSGDPLGYPYDLSPSTDGHSWDSSGPSLQRSLSDPSWSFGADIYTQTQSPISPNIDDDQPKKQLRKERRKSQNRKAQRAFRERKESRLRELEEELASVNAKYDALEKEYRHIMNQLAAMKEGKDQQLATISSAADLYGPPSPESVFESRRPSIAGAGSEPEAQPVDAQLATTSMAESNS